VTVVFPQPQVVVTTTVTVTVTADLQEWGSALAAFLNCW